jgi:hypothetical protein
VLVIVGQEFPKLNEFHKITFRTRKENNLNPSVIPESLQNEVFKKEHNSNFLILCTFYKVYTYSIICLPV